MLVWPASALLTGNGVAFILRVPGTEHGDWWSTNGWWIFAGTAAVSLLSKYVIRVRGAHVFNPSNIGLVLCFLVLGPELADPLDFWWGPMSPALALALAIIVVGGFAILSRLGLLLMALSFWVVFVVAVAVVAGTGHAMSARWHPARSGAWSSGRFSRSRPRSSSFSSSCSRTRRPFPPGDGSGSLRRAVALLAALLVAARRPSSGPRWAFSPRSRSSARPARSRVIVPPRPAPRVAALAAWGSSLHRCAWWRRRAAREPMPRRCAPAERRMPESRESSSDRRGRRVETSTGGRGADGRRPAGTTSRPASSRGDLWLEAESDQFPVSCAAGGRAAATRRSKWRSRRAGTGSPDPRRLTG